MNGVVFFVAGISLVAVVLCLLLLRKEQKARLRGETFWQTQEQTFRQSHALMERQFQQLRSTLNLLYDDRPASDSAPKNTAWAELVLGSAASIAQAGQGALYQLNSTSMEFSIVHARGLSPEILDTSRIPLGQGPLGRAALAPQETLLQVNPDHPPLQAPLIVWPLKIQGQPAALLVLGQLENPILSTEARERLSLLVQQAAWQLANKDLSDELTASYKKLVQTLARAIDARDAYTHQHSDRTRSLVQAMVDEIHLPQALRVFIEYGALLHDVGKIGIDDAILRKPGKLTPEEYDLMKKHPAIGYRILEPVPFLRPAASIVLYHQEWYNGQGYPEGLAGEEIPLGARLVSVIDAWDAMTSNRPYRSAMPVSAAVAELRKQSGTQFDPKMVDAFLRALDRLERSGQPTIEASYSHVP